MNTQTNNTMNTHGWNKNAKALLIGEGAALAAVAEALNHSGAQCIQLAHSDCADEQLIAASFDKAEQTLGGALSILVFSDKLSPAQSADTLALTDWQQSTSINLDARFFCAAELARRCIANKGKATILHLVSKQSEQAVIGQSANASCTGGVVNLNMTLAVEWGRDNIRSNIIATRLVDKIQASDTQALASLGSIAAYYCSDYASYITGSCIGIDEC